MNLRALPVLCLLSVTALAGGQESLDDVGDGGQKNNPGVKLRVTQHGLDYLNSVLKKQMNTVIPRLRVDDFRKTGGHGMEIHVTNGRVTSYRPPSRQQLKLQPPDDVVLIMENLAMSMTAHVDGSFRGISERADVDAAASDVDIAVYLTPIRQKNGQFGVLVDDCDANIGDLTLNIRNTGMMGRILQNYMKVLVNRMKPRLGNMFCNQIEKFLSDTGNRMLSSVPTKISLDEANDILSKQLNVDIYETDSGERGRRPPVSKSRQSSSSSRKSLSSSSSSSSSSGKTSKGLVSLQKNEIVQNLTKHLKLDYYNLQDPVVTRNYLETYNRGEVSYEGHGGTPFFPPPMHEPTPPPVERHVYAVVSDYLANSMFYQAHKNNLLKFRINGEKMPEFKPYLQTSCDSDDLFDMCLGSIIPEMERSFPNSDAEVLLETSDTPAVFFRKEGDIRLLAPLTVTLLATKGATRKTAAVANINMKSKYNLRVDNQLLKGNSSVDDFQMELTTNNLKDFDENRQQEFAEMAKTMLEAVTNAVLTAGIPLPTTKMATLKKSKLSIYERTARLESDVQANETMITQMINEQLKKHGSRLEGI